MFSLDEINSLFSEEDAKFVVDIFNLNKDGNFEDEVTRKENGKNILFLEKKYEKLARKYSLSEDEFFARLEKIRTKLFVYRSKRVHPHKDDKILTDWNGLMIAALAYSSKVFENKKYKNIAKKAMQFVMTKLKAPNNELLHRYREGEADIHGMIDDYAFFILALLELYDATFNVDYINTAYDIQKKMIELFWDNQNGGFYLSSINQTDLIIRKKTIYDGAIPSGNSVAYYNLLRLASLTGDPDLKSKADSIEQCFAGQISKMPFGYTMFLIGKDYEKKSKHHVILIGDTKEQHTQKIIELLKTSNLPESTIIVKDTGSEQTGYMAEYLKDYAVIGNKATAYICVDNMCLPPTNDPEKIKKNLQVE